MLERAIRPLERLRPEHFDSEVEAPFCRPEARGVTTSVPSAPSSLARSPMAMHASVSMVPVPAITGIFPPQTSTAVRKT